MPNTTPHFIITGTLFGISHYAQVGIELLKAIFAGETWPSLEAASVVAIEVSVAFFAVKLFLLVCRLALAVASILSGLEDQCVAWGKSKLVELAKWILDQLS